MCTDGAAFQHIVEGVADEMVVFADEGFDKVDSDAKTETDSSIKDLEDSSLGMSAEKFALQFFYVFMIFIYV